ncbi:MAG: DUF4262 domain-containing protein [Paraclostridium sp.]
MTKLTDTEMFKRIAQIKEQEKEWMEKYGFYIHFIFPCKDDPCKYVNIHTHGVKESFNHPDFQMVVGINSQLAAQLMHSLVNDVKAGAVFKDGDVYDKLIRNMNVRFVKSSDENDREVLRVLMPDPKGLLPGEDGCEEYYEEQVNFIVD